MDEPSVLDYLKSKLKFWKREGGIEIPADEDLVDDAQAADAPKPRIVKPAFNFGSLPWRSLLGLVFILLAQRSFEPGPMRSATLGLVLYGIGLAWVVFSCLRGEWTLAEATADEVPGVGERVRVIPLVMAMGLSVLAFLTFANNLFTLLNILLWLAALICFIWAFKFAKDGGRLVWGRVVGFLRQKAWGITVTRRLILVLAVIAVVVFFRTSNLQGIPSEPFSDHAEKIMDVYDITLGQTSIFFPRNTGREAFQMYLTVLVAWAFGTGLSFLSLKIGTVLCGLATLPFIYLLGKELGGKRVALLALLFAGIAYWPNVISRVGLRFPLYPLFVAPTLYYLIRGLRRRNQNDFIYSGIALGLGLHGYSPIRILPIVVLVAVGLYLLHRASKGARLRAVAWLAILASASLVLFLPLLRYWLQNPEAFGYRAFSRLGSIEAPLPAPVLQVFFSNLWNALKMFNWDNGEIWVHSVTHRPALDVVSGALFLAGVTLVVVRYIRKRDWVDLFLLVSIPLLQLPSILSLAFPAENPALNRAGGAYVPVFLVVALAMDGLWRAIRVKLTGKGGAILAWCVSLFLVAVACAQNYDLVFRQYANEFDSGAWNTSEMGAVIQQFEVVNGTTETVWIVPYPHWVDTRLPGVWAGIPNRDFAIWPEQVEATLDLGGPKLFIVNVLDEEARQRMDDFYPQGSWSRFVSETQLEGKDFLIFYIPSSE